MNNELNPREIFKEVISELGFADSKPSEMTNSDYWMCTIKAMERYARRYHAAKEKQKQLIVELGNEEKESEVKEVGEPCFNERSVKKCLSLWSSGITDFNHFVDWLNTRANEYRLDGMKKALAKAADNAEQEFGEWGQINIKKSSITDPKNLEA